MNYYIKRTYINSKKKIMKLDKTEIMPDSLPRSVHTIKSISAFWWIQNWCIYSEAFMSLLGGIDGETTTSSSNLSFF